MKCLQNSLRPLMMMTIHNVLCLFYFMLTLSAIDANKNNKNFTVFDGDVVVVVSVIIVGGGLCCLFCHCKIFFRNCIIDAVHTFDCLPNVQKKKNKPKGLLLCMRFSIESRSENFASICTFCCNRICGHTVKIYVHVC